MDQPLTPGWANQPITPENRLRVSESKQRESAARGRRRGSGKRWHLRNLPPVTEDDDWPEAAR